MVRLFASNTVFVLVIVPLLFTANVFLEYNFNAITSSVNHATDLWGIPFHKLSAGISNVILISILTVNAVLINYTYNKHEFFERNTYLPSLIYVLIVCFFPMSTLLNGDLFAHFFIILALHELLNIKQSDDSRRTAFNASLFIGLATTMNPVFLYFLPVFSLSLISIRKFIFREHLLAIIGFVIPFLWLFYVDKDFYSALFEFTAQLDYGRLPNYVLFAPNVIIALLLILSYRNIGLRITKSSIRFKRLMTMVLYLLLLSAISSLIIFTFFNSYFYFSSGAIALSIILPYAYNDSKKKVLPVLLIYGLIVLHIVKFVI